MHWGRWSSEPPELVLEQSLTLDASGEAKIAIDTAIAKAFQGDMDHRYSIQVEVRGRLPPYHHGPGGSDRYPQTVSSLCMDRSQLL